MKQNRLKSNTAWLIAGFLLVLSSATFADTLFLANGQRIEGKIENQSATDVFIRTPQGLRKVPKNQIRRIEYEAARKKQEEELLRQQELKRQQELQRKAEEERLKQLEEQKRLDEQRKKEEAQKKLEEQKKGDDLRKTEEQKKAEEEQKRKQPGYRQNDIVFRGGVGFQHMKPGVLGLRNAVTILSSEFNGGYVDRKDRSADISRYITMGVGINWSRFFLDLDAGVSEGKASGRTFSSQETAGSTFMYQSAELHDPIRNTFLELALRVDAYQSGFYRFRPFVGVRRHLIETETDFRSFGLFTSLPQTAWTQTTIDGGSTTSGGIAGLEFLLPMRIGPRYFGASILLGYYSGSGDAFIDENAIIYLSNGQFNLGGTKYSGAVTEKGPFLILKGTHTVNERLSLQAGLRYEETVYRFTDLDVMEKYNLTESSYIESKLRLAMLRDYISDRTKTRESIKTLDLSVTYRLPLR